MDVQTRPTVVIGGGLAGLSAALHLERPWCLLERDDRLGGLARTEHRDGFFFDCTGHWLHLRDPYTKALAQRLAGTALVEVERKARVFSHGVLTRYPFQGNLYGLPAEVVYECLLGLFSTRERSPTAAQPRNFDEYIRHHFGDGIAKHFMIPYNTKLWGVAPSEITSAWCERFVPRPNVEQVLAGALGVGPPELGYNVRFLYPRRGGIETFSRALAAELDPEGVRVGAEVEQIDADQRAVNVGGEWLGYGALIATLPLPDLVRRLKHVPEEVRSASCRLRATSVRYLNVGLRHDATAERADYHWVYVPEFRYPFYRVGVFSNAMPTMAPAGCSSLYVELSERASAAGAEEDIVRDALAALPQVGAMAKSDEVLFAELREIDPAYVIFDEAYETSVRLIHDYLSSKSIFATGRYGAWIYNAMEDSLLAGKAVAERVNLLTKRS